ncbi:MAG: ECF transporter S component [Sarcina sp.]
METNKTKNLIRIALFAAICFVATMINIPLNLGGSQTMIHLGTTAIFIAAIFLGEKAGWAGAIGCALFDAINPAFAIWIIPTFFIKGATGYIAGKIAHSKSCDGNNMKLNIIGFLAGGIVSLIGYFLVNCILYGMPAAILKLSTSVITTGIGIAIAVPLCSSKYLVKKAGIKI